MRKQQTVNPFILSNFSIPSAYRINNYGTSSDTDNTKYSSTNITKSSSGMTVSELVNAGKNTKVYSSTKLLEQFRELSSPAKDLFMYITMKLPDNQDYLEFKDADYAKIIDKSVRSVRLWRRELLWVMQARAGRANMYWINPAILFNCSRVKYFSEEYRKPVNGNNRTDVELPDPFEFL